MASSPTENALPDLFGDPGAPPGFRYVADVMTKSEESSFVRQFETLAFAPFEFHGYLGKRRIISYGHRYDYAARTLHAAEAMPGFLLDLRLIASQFTGIAAESFQQALVTEYTPGAGIGWHRDKPMFADVVGLSFLAACRLRLRRHAAGRWERRTVDIARRSAYLLQGPVRGAWEHSIPPMEALRYSVTFRTFRAAQG